MSEHKKVKTKINSLDKRGKVAQLIIARLDGKDINKKFTYYHSLVRKGIGGFIVFGGKLKEISNAIKRLQDSAEISLFISSDLEQGLGQQIEGGTLFPTSMAIAGAVDRKNKNDIKLLEKSISIIEQEARAVGINIIFSPVLDVNTNPENPIICTRAFSDNPGKVIWFGKKFIRGFQEKGLISCAKHFPGHGDTAEDSHKEVPVIKADIKRLGRVELYPFQQAVRSGVKMIMVGHLKVPALDAKFPSSLSKKIIQGLLREKMGFKGLIITDAMNMHAVSSGNQEAESRACLMALQAGADILLHPESPEKVIDYLFSKWNKIEPIIQKSFRKIVNVKKRLNKISRSQLRMNQIGTSAHWKIAKELTQKSINPASLDRDRVRKRLCSALYDRKLTVLIIDDDNNLSGKPFINIIKNHYKEVKTIYIDNRYQGDIKTVLNSISDTTLIAAVFSKVSAWKGRSGLSRKLQSVLEKAIKSSECSIVAGFCCPHILSDINPVRKRRGFLANGAKADAVIDAYSDLVMAQEAVGKILCAPG